MNIISDCECRRKRGTNCLDDACEVRPTCSLSYIRPQMLCAGSSGAEAQGISFVRFLCISSSHPVCVHNIVINAFIKKNCQGDSGGPLSVKDPVTKKHELVGVVSFAVSVEDKKVTYFG